VLHDTAVMNQEQIQRVRVVVINNVPCNTECWVSYLTRDGRKVIEKVGRVPLSTPSAAVSMSPEHQVDMADYGKMILSQTALLVMFVNTIMSVFSISADVSLIPRNDDTISYTFCDYGYNGEADNVLVACPYLPSPLFQSLLCTWMVYFIVAFGSKYWFTSPFSPSDLRFYMACDQYNSRVESRIICGIGIFLTIASGLLGISVVVGNGNDAAVGTILVFMALNIYNLIGMSYVLQCCLLIFFRKN
jgi:ABC-type dipeptide/oligopeptide/nickel transport system permease subunit